MATYFEKLTKVLFVFSKPSYIELRISDLTELSAKFNDRYMMYLNKLRVDCFD